MTSRRTTLMEKTGNGDQRRRGRGEPSIEKVSEAPLDA
jgi:hypothetical protein